MALNSNQNVYIVPYKNEDNKMYQCIERNAF